MTRASRTRQNPGRQDGSVSPLRSSRETPHSFAWLAALERANPRQATMTRTVLQRTGLRDVCSICGDSPAPIYDVLEEPFLPVRLCADCVQILTTIFGTQLRRREPPHAGEN
jgi:hypothetical protein